MNDGLLRLIDVNINRATEGLRVCEDILRLYYNNEKLSKEIKNLRHIIIKLINSSSFKRINLIQKRDIDSDKLKDFTNETELERKDIDKVFEANIKRVQESLRVLEEVIKIVDPDISSNFKSLRFKVYKTEEDFFK